MTCLMSDCNHDCTLNIKQRNGR